MSSVVCLNVGGKTFATSIATLQKDPNSMLATMTKDCWCLQKIANEKYLFIDRDPTLFAYILNFLRDGPNFTLPKNEDHLLRLKVEAEFYQLEGLQFLVEKSLTKLNPRLWKPQTGDIVEWKEIMIESYNKIFCGFINGYYLSTLESMILKRKFETSDSKRFCIIGGQYSKIYSIIATWIPFKEYSTIKTIAYSRRALFKGIVIFEKIRWSASDNEMEEDIVDEHLINKARFLMNTAQGEIEEILSESCVIVKWMNKSPIFYTAFINDRGNIQKCCTRTIKMHVPVAALKSKSFSK